MSISFKHQSPCENKILLLMLLSTPGGFELVNLSTIFYEEPNNFMFADNLESIILNLNPKRIIRKGKLQKYQDS